MTTPRRRILRSAVSPEIDRRQLATLERADVRLTRERESFRRWLSRLRRAMRAVDKHLRNVHRLEKTLALLRRA